MTYCFPCWQWRTKYWIIKFLKVIDIMNFTLVTKNGIYFSKHQFYGPSLAQFTVSFHQPLPSPAVSHSLGSFSCNCTTFICTPNILFFIILGVFNFIKMSIILYAILGFIFFLSIMLRFTHIKAKLWGQWRGQWLPGEREMNWKSKEILKALEIHCMIL